MDLCGNYGDASAGVGTDAADETSMGEKVVVPKIFSLRKAEHSASNMKGSLLNVGNKLQWYYRY